VELIDELRKRDYYEAEIEYATKHSPYRPHTRLPRRVTQAWLEENIALMSANQLRQLLAALRKRGWSEDELRQRVFPSAPKRPIPELPSRITEAFLEERAVFLPDDQAARLAATMRERGWDEEDIAGYLPQASST